MKTLLKFITILFAVITLSALMAHLLEMPAKMELSREHYAIVQGIYSGWAFLGIAEVGALLLTLIWAIIDYTRKSHFPLLLTAFFCFLLSLAIFFFFTFPANRATSNWTQIPFHWEELRRNWEYSHAVRAILNLVGFFFLVGTLLKKRRRTHF